MFELPTQRFTRFYFFSLFLKVFSSSPRAVESTFTFFHFGSSSSHGGGRWWMSWWWFSHREFFPLKGGGGENLSTSGSSLLSFFGEILYNSLYLLVLKESKGFCPEKAIFSQTMAMIRHATYIFPFRVFFRGNFFWEVKARLNEDTGGRSWMEEDGHLGDVSEVVPLIYPSHPWCQRCYTRRPGPSPAIPASSSLLHCERWQNSCAKCKRCGGHQPCFAGSCDPKPLWSLMTFHYIYWLVHYGILVMAHYLSHSLHNWAI